MKLIIDIPEGAYELLKNGGVDWLGAEHILNAVANGKPLDNLIEDAISKQEVLRQLEGCLTGGEIEYKYVKLHIDSIPPIISKNPCENAVSGVESE